MIKAVIFDMFETLVSIFEGRTFFGDDMAAAIGADRDAFRAAWHPTEHGRSVGEYTIEEGIGIALRAVGIHDAAVVDMLVKKRDEALDDTFSAVPEKTLELLSELRRRGLKIGLISNCYSNESRKIRESVLFPFFDAALLSYEQGVCKPDGEIFRRIMKELDVSPEECLYVGDGGSDELYAARNAGMKAVQALYFHDMAFEPHVPCDILPEFYHAMEQADVLKYLDSD